MSDHSVANGWKPCECLERYQQELSDLNTYIETSLVWNSQTDTERVQIAIVTRKADPRNRKKAATMIANFCPLCGTAYTEAADQWRQERQAAS